MKTAQEWVKEKHNRCDCDECKWKEFSREDLLEVFKQIQLDAFKAGMTESALLLYLNFDGSSSDRERVQSIVISARERKESL